MFSNKVVDGGPTLKVPAHLSFGQHILDCLKKNAEEDCVALINGDTGEQTRYSQMLQGVVAAATGLQRLGVRRGDTVALCSENRIEYLTAAMGAICCGATITPYNLMYTKDELEHTMRISQPRFIFASQAALKFHLKVLKSNKGLEKIVQLDGSTAVDSGVVLYNKVVENPGDARSFEAVPVDGITDTLFIIFSSGTTGLPKGVMITHLNILYQVSFFEDSAPSRNSTVIQSIVPWYHAYGLMSTLNYLIEKNVLVYFSAGFDPQRYLKAIQEHKVRVLITVPPIVVFLAKVPLVEQFDLSSVETVWCGAAPLSRELVEAAKKKMPNCNGIFQAYGMTETSLAATSDRPEKTNFTSKPGSGGAPIPGVKIKVVDIESREKLGPNQTGEICIKGPIIMKGYLGDEAASQDIIDEEGFLKTGDIGYYDSEGYFFVVDRLKELIKYKGHQVAPASVESVVLQHGGVAECGVVGRPDELAGELPVAFVVPKPGVTLSEKEVLEFANSKLSTYSRLRGGVKIVADIPKNPSGKILRRALKLQLREKSKL